MDGPGASRATAARRAPQPAPARRTGTRRAPSPRGMARLLDGEPAGRLEPGLRAAMESRFGQDFSTVPVHTGRRAADLAAATGSGALTVGGRIAFAAGTYRPATERGRALIAHELAHVVQQRAAPAGPVTATELQGRSSPLERDAETAARTVGPDAASALAGSGSGGPAPAVQGFEAREHVLAGDAGPASLSRAAGLLSQAELQLRAGRSAWTELATLRELWERNGGDPEALRLLEQATNANDEGDYRTALEKVEAATPRITAWLRGHPEAGGEVSTTVAGRAHPEAAAVAAEAGEAPTLTLRTSGLRVTYGEAVALGDLYHSNEAMHRAPRRELTNAEGTGLLDLVRAEVRGRPGFNFNAGYERATQWRDVARYDRLGRRLGTEGEAALGEKPAALKDHGLSYVELAKSDLHFAGENRRTWEAGHRSAVDKAERAAAEQDRAARQELSNDAYTTNALADHFLTDAFAAGHLMQKANFRAMWAQFVQANHDRVVDAVAAATVRDHPGAIFELASWKVRSWPGLRSIPVLGGLAGLLGGAVAWLVSVFIPGWAENEVKDTIHKLEQEDRSLLEEAASKAAHDHYNRVGVEVSNAQGDRWRAFGDDHLRRSSTTWQLMSLAVMRSRADVAETLRGRRPADVLQAWTYAPIPPVGFDRQAMDTAAELMLRHHDNPVADVFAKNIDLVKVIKPFKERETERQGEAQGRQDRLRRYLEHIRATHRIEDRMDSDDVARDIVATPDEYAKLSLREKAILVQEMLTGWTGGDDQRAILTVLRDVRASGELPELLRIVTVPRLRSKFGGDERRQLMEILAGQGRAA